jgi:hypothetical protein
MTPKKNGHHGSYVHQTDQCVIHGLAVRADVLGRLVRIDARHLGARRADERQRIARGAQQEVNPLARRRRNGR